MAGNPLTWLELRARFRERHQEELHSLVTADVARMKNRPPKSDLTLAFMGIDEVLSRIAMVDGPEPCHAAIAMQAPFFAQAVADKAAEPPARASPFSDLGLVSYANVVHCTGGTLDPSLIDGRHEKALLARACSARRKLDEFQREELTAACLALGDVQGALGALGRKKAPPFAANQRFGPNLTGLIANLIAAVMSGAPASAVQDTWEDLLAYFPRNLASKVVTWSTLLFLGRVVLCRIEERPEAEVAGLMHARIAAMA